MTTTKQILLGAALALGAGIGLMASHNQVPADDQNTIRQQFQNAVLFQSIPRVVTGLQTTHVKVYEREMDAEAAAVGFRRCLTDRWPANRPDLWMDFVNRADQAGGDKPLVSFMLREDADYARITTSASTGLIYGRTCPAGIAALKKN